MGDFFYVKFATFISFWYLCYMKIYFKEFRSPASVSLWLNKWDDHINQVISITHNQASMYTSDIFYVFYKAEHELK